jgi:hypothetical protein
MMAKSTDSWTINQHLPLAALLQRLTKDCFEGTITVKLNPDVLQAEDETQVQAHLRRTVAFCYEHTSFCEGNHLKGLVRRPRRTSRGEVDCVHPR